MDNKNVTGPTHSGFTVFKQDLPPDPKNPNVTVLPTVNVTNPNNVTMSAIFMVRAHTAASPVPGGCSKVFRGLFDRTRNEGKNKF